MDGLPIEPHCFLEVLGLEGRISHGFLAISLSVASMKGRTVRCHETWERETGKQLERKIMRGMMRDFTSSNEFDSSHDKMLMMQHQHVQMFRVSYWMFCAGFWMFWPLNLALPLVEIKLQGWDVNDCPDELQKDPVSQALDHSPQPIQKLVQSNRY